MNRIFAINHVGTQGLPLEETGAGWLVRHFSKSCELEIEEFMSVAKSESFKFLSPSAFLTNWIKIRSDA